MKSCSKRELVKGEISSFDTSKIMEEISPQRAREDLTTG